MKSKKIILLEKILRMMAVAVLARHKPKIVAITGSAGKTSTKDAVFEVLSSKFKVRENEKNYNNEIGVPLAIIGAQSGEKNLFKWLWIFFKWLYAIIFPGYPEILILELGIDQSRETNHYMSLVQSHVGIIADISDDQKEKKLIIESIRKEGFALFDVDDEASFEMAKKADVKSITFGMHENAIITASNISFGDSSNQQLGITFKLDYDGSNIPIRLRYFVADDAVQATLVAVGAGIIFKLNLVDIAKSLSVFRLPNEEKRP